MRINCPLCGERDRREFYYRGHGSGLNRPEPDAGEAAWDDFVHLRENPAGVTQDLWYHASGCTAWILVTRNTLTHEILDTVLASEVTS